MFVRGKAPEPLDPAVVDALSKVQTSTLGHLRDHGFPRGLRPVRRPLSFVGTAFTVRLPHLDSTALHVAADEVRPGDVLVVDQSGDDRSCFGGMVAYTAAARGAVGALVAGSINDVDEILELGLPVFSAGVSARTTRILGIEGSINVGVSVGGVAINPGDVIFGDSDGVAVLGRGEALEIAGILAGKEAAEPELKEKIAVGARLSEWSGALAQFEAGLPRDPVE
ncbi:RraA family protein [Amycolatopsis nigrescens]|uniref:RraA family protein n=1 Tax=Amycolatopsis nigrescens TaxID=381445 RepID=UPI0003750681|nr:RraA family protein [Amycolatopsis nigrescens]